MNALQAIQRAARENGIRDWRAVAAVAHAESGLDPGSIGDGGTSFGLFQLHQGGALGNMGNAQARQYLDAYRNASFAARQMRSLGIGHLTGRDAIAAIVSKFERPANPSGEIERAYQWYAQGGSHPVPAVSAPATADQSSAGDPLASAHPDTLALVQYLIDSNSKNAHIPSLHLPVAAAAPAPMGGDAMTAPAQPASAPMQGGPRLSGAFPLAKRGKMIGTPYSGTHTLGNWQSDNAVDISTPIGTPIIAVTDGVIDSRFGSLGKGGRFAGLRLTVDGNGNRFYYAHLSRYAAGIKPGTKVKRGQIIGYSGSANGVAHLHIGVENGNPVKLFGLG